MPNKLVRIFIANKEAYTKTEAYQTLIRKLKAHDLDKGFIQPLPSNTNNLGRHQHIPILKQFNENLRITPPAPRA